MSGLGVHVADDLN